jgi:hypothetical protein
MNQLTVRGFDPELEKRLRDLASQRQISLNRAALALMRRGAGLSEPSKLGKEVGSALDSFIGVWSEEDEAEFSKALEPLEQIDPGLWS